MVRPFHQSSALDQCDILIIGLAADGYSAKEIAKVISIAPRTVERRIEQIKLKLRARNIVHMVTLAIRAGHIQIAIDTHQPGEAGQARRSNSVCRASS